MSGIMDIGEHCAYCRQLDFLPFACDGCKKVFCASHRTQLQHHCPVLLDKSPSPPVSSSSERTKGSVSALFPDRSQDREKLEKSLSAPKKPTTIKETQFRVGDVAATTNNAFSKLKVLFGAQKEKKKSAAKRSRTVEILQLRKAAHGDPKVKPVDRVHVWCLYVDAHGDIETTKKIDVEKQRQAIWFSKQWPVGRAIDALAESLRVKNVNNSTSDGLQRLAMFTMAQDQPQLVAASERCSRFQDGDTVYLVRGG
ncbi:hypothetical protein PGUG_02012 [Meyerozyma guilliermondii ATCC 6260]|uniref:AN1-type domain-containing protein n=1 Tax=Meyerozyma guilliermondii (strain ATCC 6260 / CBS 566 / DSM 6381 / JCM 1539 / NBRC 10279 / NRRL Y-324) TaxID=294746 RepID=A5DFG1_PICGU|nr:uncharacterized protein PGUG_02012 [Meyerozyma guilliermondii ATCC 6260]EDK37914.2 hypothetical protein PGUG_02012 [Meyerozyma guilliermondii ATCC 6260]